MNAFPFPQPDRISRSALAVLACLAYGIAAAGAPVVSAECRHHAGAHGAQPAPAGPLAQTVPHEGHPHSDSEDAEHGPCTCLGTCQGAASFALPAMGISRALGHLDVTHNAGTIAREIDLPSLQPYTLPYANAPPLTA